MMRWQRMPRLFLRRLGGGIGLRIITADAARAQHLGPHVATANFLANAGQTFGRVAKAGYRSLRPGDPQRRLVSRNEEFRTVASEQGLYSITAVVIIIVILGREYQSLSRGLGAASMRLWAHLSSHKIELLFPMRSCAFSFGVRNGHIHIRMLFDVKGEKGLSLN